MISFEKIPAGNSLILKAATPAIEAMLAKAERTRIAQGRLSAPFAAPPTLADLDAALVRLNLDVALAALNRSPSRRAPPTKPRRAARPPRQVQPTGQPRPRPQATPVLRPLVAGTALGFLDFRDRIAADIQSGHVLPSPAHLVDHAANHYGLDRADAAEFVERFLADVERIRPARRHGGRQRAN
jgi:hypothetical protein